MLYSPTKENVLFRHWVSSIVIFIGTITTTTIGQFGTSDGPAKVGDVIEVETVYPLKYTYDQRLVELTTTTTTTEPKKNDHTTNVINETETCPQYEDLFRQYGLKPVKVFSYIAWRESRCRLNAVNAKWDNQGNVTWTLNKNGSIDRGLLQINSSWKTVTANVCGSEFGNMEVLYDLDCNLKVAKYLLDNGGLGHWGM
ncbi:MAG: hypothetical protein FJ211_09585 [Ignavibacteria bacterium]|nr:hypothetical protein [Ignavibacteria bacterium]